MFGWPPVTMPVRPRQSRLGPGGSGLNVVPDEGNHVEGLQESSALPPCCAPALVVKGGEVGTAAPRSHEGGRRLVSVVVELADGVGSKRYQRMRRPAKVPTVSRDP